MNFKEKLDIIINCGKEYADYLDKTMINPIFWQHSGGSKILTEYIEQFKLKFNDECCKVILNELIPRLKKNKISIENSPVKYDDIGFLVGSKILNIIDHKQLRVFLDDEFLNYNILKDSQHSLEWYYQ